MVVNACSTIWTRGMDMAQRLGVPYKPLPNTTLNEKHAIKINEVDESKYPTLQYYCIGVGGINILNNIDTYNYSEHSPTDAALFEQIPFVMREVGNDILDSDKPNYRFRKIVTINNIEYICYYLKTIDTSDYDDKYYKVSVNGDDESLAIFDTNTDAFLNPVPRDPAVTIKKDVTEYVVKKVKIPLLLTKEEVNELKNVLKILYGEDNNKYLTEVGVCTGIDKEYSDGVEATNVQIAYHYQFDTNTTILMLTDGYLNRSLEIAGMEPLITG